MPDDKTAPVAGPAKKQRNAKVFMEALQPPITVTCAVLAWYLIITRGPLAFLWLALAVGLGCLTVRRWGSGYAPSWIHWLLAFSVVGSAVYGFCRLNVANTRTRHTDVVFCDADRDQTQWNSGDEIWKIETQNGEYFVEGGRYQGVLADADGAVHGFVRGSVYRITFHGGYAGDRYMTGAEQLPGKGSCGEHD